MEAVLRDCPTHASLTGATDEPQQSARDRAHYRFARRLSGKVRWRRLTWRWRPPCARRAAGRAPPSQAGRAATRWVWSLRRLWVPAMSRHSDRHAARPRRWKRLIRRLNFSWPKTGSMVTCRVREAARPAGVGGHGGGEEKINKHRAPARA